MIIGIVVALPEELATLTASTVAKGSCLALTDKVWVACSGAGAANAAEAAKLLVANGVNRLISWGCAGALSPDLRSGDLVVAERLIAADNEELTMDVFWHTHTLDRLQVSHTVYTGDLVETLAMVAVSKDKRRLHEQTGAIAVDMESVAVARVAWQYALPFLSIRAIADPASMDLPPAVSYALNANGEIELWKLLVFLLRHPTQIPRLIKLGLHFNAAMKTLEAVAEQLELNDTPRN